MTVPGVPCFSELPCRYLWGAANLLRCLYSLYFRTLTKPDDFARDLLAIIIHCHSLYSLSICVLSTTSLVPGLSKKHFYPYTAVTQSLLSCNISLASLQLYSSTGKYIENGEIYREQLIFFQWVITYSILSAPLPPPLPHWISSTCSISISGMNTKLFLPKEKLTHKGIAVKGDSSFHRAPKPISTEIRPCRNRTTKAFSPSGTCFTLAYPSVPSAVLIPQAFFIQGTEGCLN